MLFKSAFNTLKKRYLQLLLLGIIILLSSFIYTVMSYAIGGTEIPTDQYLEDYNQEDFAISMLDVLFIEDYNYLLANSEAFQNLDPSAYPYTLSGVKSIDEMSYYAILDQRISTIENTYPDIKLEIRESKDIYFSTEDNSYRIRVLKDMNQINLSYIVEGRKPLANNEIAVTQIFANKNNLTVGDSLTIHDVTYLITGFVLFPDYSLMMLDQSIIIDNKTQTLALLSDEGFENLSETVQFEGAGVFLNGYTNKLFKTDVVDDYKEHNDLAFITGIMLTINNMRSGAIYTELTAGRSMSLFMSILISSIALMIVGIVVSRVIKSQRGQIGILKAMGYKNSEIAVPYLIDIGILTVPMVILGYYLGYLMAYPMMQIYLEFYLIPYQDIVQNTSTIVVAIVVPLVFIIGLSYLVIMKLLKQEPLTLLNPEVISDTNKLTLKISKVLNKTKITTKLQQILLFRSPIKILVFMIGMFLASFLVLFTFSMNDIFGRMVYDFYEQNEYTYIGYTTYVNGFTPLDGQEEVIEIQSVIINGNDASIVGINSDHTLNPLYDKSGHEITHLLKEGIVITESISLTQNIRIGDEVLIKFGDKTYTDVVSGVAYEYTGNKVYIEREVMSLEFFDQVDYYNVIYSTTQLDENDYYVVLKVADIIKQVDAMNSLMKSFVWIMVTTSISIGVIIIYILTSMAIEDQYYNISLFKVLGYNQKEINQMILGGYLIYGLMIFIISIPVSILSFKLMEIIFAQFFNLLFPMRFYLWHGAINLGLYFLIFYISSKTAKNKLDNISLQETMKMYEE